MEDISKKGPHQAVRYKDPDDYKEQLTHLLQSGVYDFDGELKGVVSVEDIIAYDFAHTSLWKTSLHEYFMRYGVTLDGAGVKIGELRTCSLKVKKQDGVYSYLLNFSGLFSGITTLEIKLRGKNECSIGFYSDVTNDDGFYDAHFDITGWHPIEKLPELLELSAEYLLDEDMSIRELFCVE